MTYLNCSYNYASDNILLELILRKVSFFQKRLNSLKLRRKNDNTNIIRRMYRKS